VERELLHRVNTSNLTEKIRNAIERAKRLRHEERCCRWRQGYLQQVTFRSNTDAPITTAVIQPTTIIKMHSNVLWRRRSTRELNVCKDIATVK
jgi:hypothetical protein